MDFDLLISKLLSPVELAICFGIIFYASGKPWSIPAAAAAATLASAWAPSSAGDRSFWYSLLACTIQSIVVYGLILLKNKLTDR